MWTVIIIFYYFKFVEDTDSLIINDLNNLLKELKVGLDL